MVLSKSAYYDEHFFTKTEFDSFLFVVSLHPNEAIFIIDSHFVLKFYNTKFSDFYSDIFLKSPQIGINLKQQIGVSNLYGFSSKEFLEQKDNEKLDISTAKVSASIHKTFFTTSANNKALFLRQENSPKFFSNVRVWESIMHFSKSILDINNINQVFEELNNIVASVFSKKDFYLGFYDNKDGSYQYKFFKDENLVQVNNHIEEFYKVIIDTVVDKRQILFIDSKGIDDILDERKISISGEKPKSVICKSIFTDNEFVAAFQLCSFSRDFTKEEFGLFNVLLSFVEQSIKKIGDEKLLIHEAEKVYFINKVADFFHWEYHPDQQEVFMRSGEINNSPNSFLNNSISLKQFLGFFIQSDSEHFHQQLLKICNNEITDFFIEVQLKPNSMFNSQYAHFTAGRFYDKFLKKNIIIGNFQDITKLKINEIKLLQAKQKAEESDKLKSSFLANMSHEIRTPLNGILGFSRLLSSNDIDQEKRERYIEYISRSGQSLLYLINDILDLAKIESGKFTIKIKDCLINEMLDELQQSFIHQLGVKDKSNIEIRLKKGIQAENFAIKTDPLRLRQVFNNLIGNSLKFTEDGYIEYGYTLDKANSTICFYVEDTGIGIPKDKIDYVFSRFGKIENGRIINPGGTGLGLSIVKQIVEYLKGDIIIDSVEGKGTRFDFKFVYEKVYKEPKQKEPSSPSIDDYEIIHVLVVEDNKINQQLIFDTLMTYSNNLKITIAENGKVALDKLRDKCFDIILMDIQMPVMDGYQATKAIRKLENITKRNIPIIGLSAHALKKEADNCISIGMNSYLSKPFIPDIVLSEIAKQIGLNKNEAETQSFEQIYHINNQIMLDLTTLRQMYGDDEERVKSILLLYKQQIPLQINDLKSNLLEEDWENIKINSHALKGNLSYLGNDGLREFAYKIELNAKNELNIGDAQNDFASLEQIWNSVFIEINKFLN